MESFVKSLFALFAFFSIVITVGIVGVLLFETLLFFQQVSPWRFFTETEWTPLFTNQRFGIIVLLTGTLLTTIIALTVALPIGLLSAIYLSEYAPDRVRLILKPLLELLAGIPTVVYGYFALLTVTPFLQRFLPDISGLNALSAGLVMGVMIIPTVASLSEDALRIVPITLREGSYGLGATKYETVVKVVVPAALSGIVASFVLAFSRAVGETMIVALAAGQNPILTLNPLKSVQTMTAFIVQVSLGDTPTGSLAFQTIFAVGMTLFSITLVLNVLSNWFVRRFRNVYD